MDALVYQNASRGRGRDTCHSQPESNRLRTNFLVRINIDHQVRFVWDVSIVRYENATGSPTLMTKFRHVVYSS